MSVSMSVWGPDLSGYQSGANIAQIQQDGASFVFLKASEGGATDPAFAAHWKAARTKPTHLVRGAYHYGHTENNPVTEATHFVNVVKTAGGFYEGDFAILDIEDVCPASHKVNAEQSVKWCKVWLDTVCKLTDLPVSRVIVYTGMWWWEPRAGSSTLCADHPLWLSGYSIQPPAIVGWKSWTFWQYTDAKQVQGAGKVDASVFNGTVAALHKLSGLPS